MATGLKKAWTPLSVYFGLATLGGLIGSIISFAIFISQTASYTLITDEEYLMQHHREVTQCEEPLYKPNDIVEERSQEEIDTCQEEARERVLLERSVRYKETAILSLLWFVILISVFGFHYRVFRKMH